MIAVGFCVAIASLGAFVSDAPFKRIHQIDYFRFFFGWNFNLLAFFFRGNRFAHFFLIPIFVLAEVEFAVMPLVDQLLSQPEFPRLNLRHVEFLLDFRRLANFAS